MRHRAFGKTGLSVSELGFGCGPGGGLLTGGTAEEVQRKVIRRALEAGVNFFDTSELYGQGRSEENLGKRLRELEAADRVAVATKVMLRRADLADPRSKVRKSLQESLRRLGRDAVDLVQVHSRIRPPGGDGPTAPEMAGIVADALDAVVADGLARHRGFTGLGESQGILDVIDSGRMETVQAYYNALNPSAGVAGVSNGDQDFLGAIDRAAGRGMGVIGVRAMAAGALSGTLERAANAASIEHVSTLGTDYDADVRRARRLVSVAREAGIETTTELGFRFVLAKEGISTVLIGFSDLAQLEAALSWVERGPLDARTVERIVAIAAGAGEEG